MLLKQNNCLNLLLAICFLICTTQIDAYRYLAIMPLPSTSHHILTSSILKALAAKGHEVTVATPFTFKEPVKNYNIIHTPGVAEKMSAIMGSFLDWIDVSYTTTYKSALGMGLYTTQFLFEEPKIQELLNSNQKFDAVLCEFFVNEAIYGFAQHFNAPLIGISTIGAFSWNTDPIGSPSPPSYVPHPFLPFTEKMTLWERILNLAFLTFERFYLDFVYLPQQEALYRKYFPNAQQSMYEVRKNAALVLNNQHISLSFSRPYVKNQIEVGGLQINRERKPLPAEMQKFIDEAKDGVIYFSMGSNLKSTNLPLEKREILLNIFRGLKQRVLWKFEDPNLPNKPDNVLISDWFPQDDILAQDNVRFFITHGGLLSTTESIYHGKPFIGIPIFADQFLNLQRAERYGYGITVNYKELTTEKLKSAIERMLNNPNYSKMVKDVSQRFRDQPMEPRDLAVYWIEHVTKHKGASYMHCQGLELNFIQYHNIDAMLILFGTPILMLLFVFYLIKSKLTKKAADNNGGKRKVKTN